MTEAEFIKASKEYQKTYFGGRTLTQFKNLVTDENYNPAAHPELKGKSVAGWERTLRANFANEYAAWNIAHPPQSMPWYKAWGAPLLFIAAVAGGAAASGAFTGTGAAGATALPAAIVPSALPAAIIPSAVTAATAATATAVPAAVAGGGLFAAVGGAKGVLTGLSILSAVQKMSAGKPGAPSTAPSLQSAYNTYAQAAQNAGYNPVSPGAFTSWAQGGGSGPPPVGEPLSAGEAGLQSSLLPLLLIGAVGVLILARRN